MTHTGAGWRTDTASRSPVLARALTRPPGWSQITGPIRPRPAATEPRCRPRQLPVKTNVQACQAHGRAAAPAELCHLPGQQPNLAGRPGETPVNRAGRGTMTAASSWTPPWMRAVPDTPKASHRRPLFRRAATRRASPVLRSPPEGIFVLWNEDQGGPMVKTIGNSDAIAATTRHDSDTIGAVGRPHQARHWREFER
jgi:hypothetical protein